MKIIKAAAVQLSPVLYSREGTVEKVCHQSLSSVAKASSSRPCRRPWFLTTPILVCPAALQDERGVLKVTRTGCHCTVEHNPRYREEPPKKGSVNPDWITGFNSLTFNSLTPFSLE